MADRFGRPYVWWDGLTHPLLIVLVTLVAVVLFLFWAVSSGSEAGRRRVRRFAFGCGVFVLLAAVCAIVQPLGKGVTIGALVVAAVGVVGSVRLAFGPSRSRTVGSGIALMTAAIVGLIAMPEVASATNAAKRSSCRDQVKTAAWWIAEEIDRTGTFPDPVADGRTWRLSLIGRDAVPTSSPTPQPLRCAFTYGQPTATDYALVTGPGTLFVDGRGTRREDVTGGLSNQILLGEAVGLRQRWDRPGDIDIAREVCGINLPGPTPGTAVSWFSSHHASNTVTVGLADGGIRGLSGNIDPDVLQKLVRVESIPAEW